MMIDVFSTNVIDALQTKCANFLVYDYIYISFGSRCNESYVYFNNEKSLHSNAVEQMYPIFLNRPHSSILIVTIDVFKTQKSIDIHINNMGKVLAENVHFVIVNQLCDIPFINKFMRMVVNKLQHANYPSSHFMVSNFIRFKHLPNATEKEFEETIPKTIQTVLNTTDDYSECFYQWFGYRYLFYNYLYNYKLLHSYPSMYTHINEIELLIDKLAKTTLTNKIVVQNRGVIFALHHIYNFCEQTIFTDKIASSLYDDMVNEDMILFVP